jgi:hypothetical protein
MAGINLLHKCTIYIRKKYKALLGLGIQIVCPQVFSSTLSSIPVSPLILHPSQAGPAIEKPS